MYNRKYPIVFDFKHIFNRYLIYRELDFDKLKQGKSDLLRLLDETVRLLSLPENDFVWSRWMGAEDALAELKMYQDEVSKDDFSHIQNLCTIFAPTGPLQEVSISSGWCEEYLDLAERYDQAEAIIQGIESDNPLGL